jgi:hypothetical protein
MINGGMDVWQRGTSFVGTAYNYTADRWLAFRGAFASGATFSRVTSTQTGFQYALKTQRDSGNSGTDVLHLREALETSDSLRFAGQTVTLSFYAKAGTNFSPTSSILVSTIYTGEGTDQATNNMTGWTSVSTNAQNNTLTTSWQRFTQTTSVTSAKTQIGIAFTYTPTGTAGADDSYQITGVQLEVGSQATPFIRAGGGTIQQELAACERYYQRVYSDVAYGLLGTGKANFTNNLQISVPFQTQMRTTPTTVDTSAMSTFLFEQGGTSGNTPTSITINSNINNSKSGAVDVVKVATFVVGSFYWLLGNNTTSAYLGFSAEL